MRELLLHGGTRFFCATGCRSPRSRRASCADSGAATSKATEARTSCAACLRGARSATRSSLGCACPRRAKPRGWRGRTMAKSSKQWLRRHVTDAYVKKAKEQGYRSRAAFKLLEIDKSEKLLKPGSVVVDLGAAP